MPEDPRILAASADRFVAFNNGTVAVRGIQQHAHLLPSDTRKLCSIDEPGGRAAKAKSLPLRAER